MAGAFPCCCKKKGTSTSSQTSSRMKCCTEYLSIALTFDYDAASDACADTISNWIIPISQTIQSTPTLSICAGSTPKTDWCDIIVGPLDQFRCRWWTECEIAFGSSIPTGYVRVYWRLKEEKINLVFGGTTSACISGTSDRLGSGCYATNPAYIDCPGTCDSFTETRDRATELTDYAGPRVLKSYGVSCNGWSYMRISQAVLASI